MENPSFLSTFFCFHIHQTHVLRAAYPVLFIHTCVCSKFRAMLWVTRQKKRIKWKKSKYRSQRFAQANFHFGNSSSPLATRILYFSHSFELTILYQNRFETNCIFIVCIGRNVWCIDLFGQLWCCYLICLFVWSFLNIIEIDISKYSFTIYKYNIIHQTSQPHFSLEFK